MPKRPPEWKLYVLKLDQGKWYVGITSKSVECRFNEHKKGYGANWTRKYKPIKIHYYEHLGPLSLERAQLREGRVTRRYMEEYGDNNVRGGDLSHMHKYVKRFGYFWDKEGWEMVVFLAFSLLLNIFFIIYIFYL